TQQVGTNLDVTGASSFDAGTGAITLNNANLLAGQVSLDGGIISLINNQTLQVGAVNTVGGGSLTLATTAGELQLQNAINADGAVDLTGAAGIDFENTITTTGDNVDFNSAVTLTGTGAAVNTGAGAGDIYFDSTIDAVTTQGLNLNAGTGNIAFNQTLGGTTRLGDLVLSSGTLNDLPNT